MSNTFEDMDKTISKFNAAIEEVIRKYPACKGEKCGATDGKSHSPECLFEYAKATNRRSPAWKSSKNDPPPEYVRILIYSEKDGFHRSYLNDHGQYMSAEMLSTQYKPTHWMPLPEPPE